MRWKRMLVMLVGAGVVFGGVYGFIQFKNMKIAEYFANMPKPVISVTTSEATSETWDTTVPAVGTLRAINGVDVTTAIAGQVQKIMFESGQEVKAGQTLVVLDSEIQQANRDAIAAEEQLAEANYKRVSSLKEGSVVSQARIDENLFAMQAAKARVASLDAEIAKKTITAPFEGRVGIRQVDLGEYLQPGSPIVNLQDLKTMRVEFSVGQRDVREVVPGRQIRVTSDAVPGTEFTGEITSLEPRADPATGLIRVEGSLPNPDGVLRPGMFVSVEVNLADKRDVVVIPESAISFNLYGDFVYVVEPKAEDAEYPTVKRVVVEAGDRRDGNVVILSGVSAGETVVTSGQLKLSPGMQIDASAGELDKPAVTDQNY
ncbi:efflux RND transporter periplasmic adaptor subunit [Microbaculum marinum]|uniref:Efflux RND transporter periplasmic adaptor subunit n=1 Tax=Microbaculum marinum TaxID=1764581 RepID=A0AAW9RNQ1_9HYPH